MVWVVWVHTITHQVSILHPSKDQRILSLEGSDNILRSLKVWSGFPPRSCRTNAHRQGRGSGAITWPARDELEEEQKLKRSVACLRCGLAEPIDEILDWGSLYRLWQSDFTENLIVYISLLRPNFFCRIGKFWYKSSHFGLEWTLIRPESNLLTWEFSKLVGN